MGGIILGALGGAGEAMVSAGAKEQASQSAQELENLRASLEDQKEQRINAYKDQGATQAQGFLKTASSTQVPQEAAPVTSLSGADPTHTYVPDAGDKTGTVAPGFTGDPVAMRRTLNALPESADKTAALAQLDRQISADTATNQGIVAGKMRDRSSSEVTDSAYDQAMRTGDVKAATAIKALQSDKFTKVGANEMVLDRNGRVVIANTAGAELAAAHDESSERRANIRADASERAANARADATENAAQIRAEASMANTQARIDAQTAGMSKGQKSAWIQQYDVRMTVKGATTESVLDDMGESKHKSDDQLTLDIMKGLREGGVVRPPKDYKGDPTEFYMGESKKTLELLRAGGKPTATSSVNPPSMPDLPAGAKLVGKTGGKDTYETPDGKRYVSQ